MDEFAEVRKEWIGREVVITDPGNPYNNMHGVIESIRFNELDYPAIARIKLDGLDLSYYESMFSTDNITFED